MKKQRIIIILVILLPQLIVIVSAAAERPLEDCSLFIDDGGFHFVTDIWEGNFTCSKSFKILQNFKLRLYLENGLNYSLSLYLPDFKDDTITRASNLTLKPHQFTAMIFVVQYLGDFIIEANNISQKIFTIHVIEYLFLHFYEQPLMITVASFPLAVFAGIIGTASEKISEKKKQKKFKHKLSKLTIQKLPIFSNPMKKNTDEILEAYHQLKQIQNVPISHDDIQKALEETIIGFKYLATNPELLIKSSETTLPIKQYPIQIIKEEELQNEFKKALTNGHIASIKVALLLKQVMSTNRQLLALVGRQQSEIRLLRAQAANLKYERDILDKGLVEADGSIIHDSLPSAELKEMKFFEKNKTAVLGVIVFIIIAVIVFAIIAIINNMPAIGG